MRRSEINKAIAEAKDFFVMNGWALPPNPQWDVTDFGLGNFCAKGLVLINLSLEKEYCEKIMYATKGQVTPAHYHKVKKEDIIVRRGQLALRLWPDYPEKSNGKSFEIKVNSEWRSYVAGEVLVLADGERITISPEIVHEFYPVSDACMIGEVSTANDDHNDNYFIDSAVGRFSEVVEDERPVLKLVSDK